VHTFRWGWFHLLTREAQTQVALGTITMLRVSGLELKPTLQLSSQVEEAPGCVPHCTLSPWRQPHTPEVTVHLPKADSAPAHPAETEVRFISSYHFQLMDHSPPPSSGAQPHPRQLGKAGLGSIHHLQESCQDSPAGTRSAGICAISLLRRQSSWIWSMLLQVTEKVKIFLKGSWKVHIQSL
jgi:hypothetical protein